VIRSNGCCFKGLAASYSTKYPEQLASIIPPEDYEQAIDQINEILLDFWPCPLCQVLGFFCCCFTMGVSLFSPIDCIKDAEENLQGTLKSLNAQVFSARKVRLRLKRGYFSSRLIVESLRPLRNQSLPSI